MSFLVSLIVAGVLAVVAAIAVLYVRERASENEPWPDQNPKDDEEARQNALRILTIALIVFTLAITSLGAFHGTMLMTLPVAAMALIAILAVRIRMHRRRAQDLDSRTYWKAE